MQLSHVHANGNLTSDGSTTMVYDAENRLVSASGASTASLSYEPCAPLFQTSGGAPGTTRFLYDGDELVAEYNASGTMLRRYVHGLGTDDPILWYEGATLTQRRSLLADHQGSIIGVANSQGTSIAINAYDAWGIPNSTNQGRLQETALGVTTRFGYDGMAMIAEYDSSNQLTRRYVPGAGVDEPLVWYEGSGTSDKRWLHADERGSIIAVSNASGVVTNINSYDEYGIPGPANAGRFQYTGQAWLPELGLYHYKARAYSPTLGRFLQTDPIGYGDGMNMYAYVGGDPVNRFDPTGLTGRSVHDGSQVIQQLDDIVVTATRMTFASGSLAEPISFGNLLGEFAAAGGGEGPQNMQPQMCPIAYTPQGDTKGENPRPASGRYNTDLPGGFQDAWKVFSGLSRLAGEPGYTIVPNPSFDNATTLAVSQPGGSVRLRVGVDYSGGARVGFSPRIDIKAGTFDLKVAETIHFTGGKGNMCPTR